VRPINILRATERSSFPGSLVPLPSQSLGLDLLPVQSRLTRSRCSGTLPTARLQTAGAATGDAEGQQRGHNQTRRKHRGPGERREGLPHRGARGLPPGVSGAQPSAGAAHSTLATALGRRGPRRLHRMLPETEARRHPAPCAGPGAGRSRSRLGRRRPPACGEGTGPSTGRRESPSGGV